jgi:hypothetical protein
MDALRICMTFGLVTPPKTSGHATWARDLHPEILAHRADLTTPTMIHSHHLLRFLTFS